ncbi:MAG: peptidoglycan/LPS O-acetylase OafA/YrhL [Oleiphilaceae bacterium]|jgi:peptidoglycan/LPS O-acetylase OafA/YrhL
MLINIGSNHLELGREAVIIFFILSGYVISYTTTVKSQSPKQYFIARASRIYSVALPVLLLSFAIGVYLTSEKYADFYQYSKPYLYIPFHLLFLGEISVFQEKPFLLVPYWSLSYEVWYYALFAVVYFLKGFTRIFILALLVLFLGHRLFLLLPVWWAGVWLYHNCSKYKLSHRNAMVLFFFSITLAIFFKVSELPLYLREHTSLIWPGYFPALGSADRFISDYFWTLIILLNFYSLHFINFKIPAAIETKVRLFATYTFTLYLAHMLVIEVYARHFKNEASGLIEAFVVILIIVFSTYLIGELTEKRKYLFSSFLKKVI